jgi:hypothetical protein
VQPFSVGFRYTAFEIFELRVLLVCVLWVEPMWLVTLNAITDGVLEDGLNVFLVADVVAELGDRTVPRDRAIYVITVEVVVI